MDKIDRKILQVLQADARTSLQDIGQAVGLSPAAALFVGLLRGEGHLECIAYPQAQPSGARLAHWAEQAVTVFLRAFGRGSGTPG